MNPTRLTVGTRTTFHTGWCASILRDGKPSGYTLLQDTRGYWVYHLQTDPNQPGELRVDWKYRTESLVDACEVLRNELEDPEPTLPF